MHSVTDRHEYAAFELLVASETVNGYPVTVTQSPAGDASGFCQLDAGDSRLQELTRASAHGVQDETLLFDLGDLLFSRLFVPPIATLFRSSLNIVRAQGKGLRVRLCIEPPALAALPWEYLHDAQEDIFLAISPETALARYVSIHVPVRPASVSVPLRVLTVIAGPRELQPLDVEQEKAIIQDALADSIQGGRVQLQFVERATVAEISQAMRRFQPHVFHFIGHGVFDRDRARVALEDEAGSLKSVDDRTFRELFTGFPETRLVVLNSCQTATLSSTQSLLGMAPRILQRQLSAVVAMQYPILVSTTRIFAREFYRSLALGYPVDAAISEARRGIYLEAGSQSPDWGIPVLFLRTQDGQLFQVEGTEEKKPPIDSAPPAIQDNQQGVATQANTQGGANIGGNVQTGGGGFVGRDKISGDRTEVHIGSVGEDAQVVTGDVTGVVARDISGGIVIGSVTGDVRIEQTVHIEIPPPPAPELPPEQRDFVGREEELEYYAEKVRTSGFAVICGMAGAGKTALATVLARRIAEPYRIFWHSFHEDEGFDAIIWHLAGFLAWQGTDDLWEMLQRARQTGGRPPPNDTLLEYVIQAVRAEGYLLCFDDFQFVIEEPLFAELVSRLRSVLAAGELSLIVTSRSMPDFVQAAEFKALGGLAEADTRHLLAARGVSLPGPLVADLHKQTEGNAQLLTLAITALQHTADPAQLIARLVESDDIERYLMNQVDEGLNTNERASMGAVAVLLGYTGTRQAIEATLGGDGLGRSLRSLRDRYLLTAYTGPSETEYGQHAIVQAFYYKQLGARKRKEMHRRAGEYYKREEPDALKAARHFQAAGEPARAAELATRDVWAIINQGQALTLRRLLERFEARQLDTLLWAAVNIALGQIYSLQGESSLAQDGFRMALDKLEMLPGSGDAQLLRVRAYRGMGEVLQHQTPEEALTWLQRGLDEIGQAGSDAEAKPYQEETALLHILSGSVYIALSDYQDAEKSVQHALELLPEEPHQLRASALLNLGSIYSQRGDLVRSRESTQRALDISRQLNDHLQMLATLHNLGIVKETAGDWDGALADYREALALAERLGSIYDQVSIMISISSLYTKRSDCPPAATTLAHAEDLARRHAFPEALAYVLVGQGELKIALGEWSAAGIVLEEAAQLADESDAQYPLPYIEWGRSQVRLGQGDASGALAPAERAVQLARDLELKLEQGRALRVLGQALLANEQHIAALEAFEQSLLLVADDPYEAARTRMYWGLALALNGEGDRGRSLLQRARSTFGELGAKRDLVAADDALRHTIGASDMLGGNP